MAIEANPSPPTYTPVNDTVTGYAPPPRPALPRRPSREPMRVTCIRPMVEKDRKSNAVCFDRLGSIHASLIDVGTAALLARTTIEMRAAADNIQAAGFDRTPWAEPRPSTSDDCLLVKRP